MAKLNRKQIASRLKELHGNVSATARALGVTRHAIIYHVQKDATLAQIITDAREGMVDNAESALNRSILAGEGWAVMFSLKTIGKKRGYVERQELTGAEGGPVQVEQVTLDERRRRVEELIAQARRQCVQAGVESRG